MWVGRFYVSPLRLVAVLAGVAVVAGGGFFAFTNLSAIRSSGAADLVAASQAPVEPSRGAAPSPGVSVAPPPLPVAAPSATDVPPALPSVPASPSASAPVPASPPAPVPTPSSSPAPSSAAELPAEGPQPIILSSGKPSIGPSPVVSPPASSARPAPKPLPSISPSASPSLPRPPDVGVGNSPPPPAAPGPSASPDPWVVSVPTSGSVSERVYRLGGLVYEKAKILAASQKRELGDLPLPEDVQAIAGGITGDGATWSASDFKLTVTVNGQSASVYVCPVGVQARACEARPS